MWTYDGEEWFEEGGSEKNNSKPEIERRQWFDEMVPELQVIEIVPLPNKNRDVPPLPMP